MLPLEAGCATRSKSPVALPAGAPRPIENVHDWAAPKLASVSVTASAFWASVEPVPQTSTSGRL